MIDFFGKLDETKRLWPFGAAVIYLVEKYPPYPSILFTTGEAEFTGLKALGLFVGLIVGLYLTKRTTWLRSKLQSVIVITTVAILVFVLTLTYFQLLNGVENHFDETLVSFFALNISIGILLFLVSPALALVIDTLKGR